MPLKKVREMVFKFPEIPLLSMPAVSQAVYNRMIDRQWTRKRLARVTIDKLSSVNVNYCQDFLNFITNVKPT